MDITRGAEQIRPTKAASRGIFGTVSEPVAQVLAILITVLIMSGVALGLNSLAERMLGV